MPQQLLFAVTAASEASFSIGRKLCKIGLTCIWDVVELSTCQFEIAFPVLCEHFVEGLTREEAFPEEEVIEYGTNTKHV